LWLVAVAVYLAVRAIRNFVHGRIKQMQFWATIENVGGGVAGVVRMVTFMTFLTILISLMRSPFWHEQVSKNSTFGSYVVARFPAVADVVKKEYRETLWFMKDFRRRAGARDCRRRARGHRADADAAQLGPAVARGARSLDVPVALGQEVFFGGAPCDEKDVLEVTPWWQLDAKVAVCRKTYRPEPLLDAKGVPCQPGVKGCGCGPYLMSCLPSEALNAALKKAYRQELRQTVEHVVANDSRCVSCS